MTLSSVETEDQLQIRISRWLDIMLPPGSLWHHSPNEGARHVSYKVKQKRMGTKPGWPDIEIFVPGDQTKVGISISIFLEIKTGKGRLSAAQTNIKERLEKAGCFWCLCRSLEQVHEFLEGLIKLRGR